MIFILSLMKRERRLMSLFSEGQWEIAWYRRGALKSWLEQQAEYLKPCLYLLRSQCLEASRLDEDAGRGASHELHYAEARELLGAIEAELICLVRMLENAPVESEHVHDPEMVRELWIALSHLHRMQLVLLKEILGFPPRNGMTQLERS